MNEAWPNAPSLEIDAFLFFKKTMTVIFFFFLKMNEAWPNAPSSTINVNFEKSYCVGTFNKANIGVKQDQNEKTGQNKDCWNDGSVRFYALKSNLLACHK